jgi:hypothetical protein
MVPITLSIIPSRAAEDGLLGQTVDVERPCTTINILRACELHFKMLDSLDRYMNADSCVALCCDV